MSRCVGGRRWWVVWAFCALTGCWSESGREVVVYSALDAEFSEPILSQFEQESGWAVRSVFDVESTKTVGLVTRLIEEQGRPRCDIFWNNEILHTLRLERLGLLTTYPTPAGAEIPAAYRSATGAWYGFAARARVLIVNRELVESDAYPRSIEALADPRWKGRAAIAKPLFGTTATHAAVLYATWGESRAREFFAQVKGNVRVLGGNKQVAVTVARGDLAFGLPDTDDAILEQEAGRPVEIIYPDQQEGGLGTLLIPNTVALIRGGPHPEAARALIDYLLSDAVEMQLAEAASAQIPLRPHVTVRSRALPAGESVRWMEADFAAAAAAWETAAGELRDLFAAAE